MELTSGKQVYNYFFIREIYLSLFKVNIQSIMTTISFTVPQDADISKILEILKVFEAKNIVTDNNKGKVPKHVLQEIEKGLEDVKNGNVIPSELVHKQMGEYVQNRLDK